MRVTIFRLRQSTGNFAVNRYSSVVVVPVGFWCWWKLLQHGEKEVSNVQGGQILTRQTGSKNKERRGTIDGSKKR